MKILSNSTLAALSLLAVTGLSGCSSEGILTDGQETEPGKPTTMTLKLDLSGTAVTKASQGDENATDAESAISYLDVFIYGSTGILESNERINHGQLTNSGGNVYTANLKTTTGQKTVYVGVNMPDGLIQKMKATSAEQLGSVPANIGVVDVSKEGTFPMFSTVAATPEFVAENDADAGTSNTVKVNVERLAAKFAVGCSADDDTPGFLQGAEGQITDLKFLIDNTNKMFYLTYGGGEEKDANMTVDEYKGSDFEQVGDFSDAVWKSITLNKSYNEVGDWETAYSTENLTSDKQMKGITRVVVQGTFTPEKTFKSKTTDPNEFEEVSGEISEGETYYQLDFPELNGAYAFFKSDVTDADLKKFMTWKGVSGDLDTALAKAKRTYTDGKNYWWITVDKGRGDVLRNTFYKMDIKSIWAPGREDGEFDPDKDDEEIPQETDILVEVTVANWSLHNQDVNLHP